MINKHMINVRFKVSENLKCEARSEANTPYSTTVYCTQDRKFEDKKKHFNHFTYFATSNIEVAYSGRRYKFIKSPDNSARDHPR